MARSRKLGSALTSGPNQAGGWNRSGGLVVLERHADQIERFRGEEALDSGGVRVDRQVMLR